MKIDISRLLATPNDTKEQFADLEMVSFTSKVGTFPIQKKQPFNICLSNENAQYLVIKFDTTIVLQIPCDRCLEEQEVEFRVTVCRRVPIVEGDVIPEDDVDGYSFIEEKQLDVDRLIYDEILVNWPAKVLCKDDCKGICPVCGQNRNHHECGCDAQVLDPRMAKFQDIFQQFKEV